MSDKPIAPLEELRVELANLLEDARALFKDPSNKRLTIIVRQPGEPERDCIVTDDTPDGMLEAVSRRFPERSAIPRAQIEKLEAELRAHADADKFCDDKCFARKLRTDWKAERDCADRLSALLHPELKGEDKP